MRCFGGNFPSPSHHAHGRGARLRVDAPCVRTVAWQSTQRAALSRSPGLDPMASTTVFATCFLPDGRHLLAADSAGQVHLWEVDPLLQAQYWEAAPSGHKPAPVVSHQLHSCAIFSVCLLSDTVLLTGGDDCIKVWKIASLLPGQRQAPQPTSTLEHPQVQVGRGGRLPVSETNGLAVNASRTTVFSACGDGRAYAWDAATLQIKDTFEGHTNYLHCVACQNDDAIVTGSEDGTVRLWDARDPRESEEMASPVDSGSPPAWIGAVDIDPGGQWVAAGGGGRYVGMWHLPSRRFVAAMPTCGAVQALTFCDDKLVSGGAEPALSLWSRSGKLVGREKTPVDCTYTIASRALSLGRKNSGLEPRIAVAAGTSTDLAVLYRGGASFGFCLSSEAAGAGTRE